MRNLINIFLAKCVHSFHWFNCAYIQLQVVWKFLLISVPVGVKASYLALVYYTGSAVGSVLWSWVSDVIGRKTILLVGAFNCIVFQLAFAFR